MDAFVQVYLERPAFVMIWLRGRTNQAVKEYVREHNQQVAADLLSVCLNAGLVESGTTALVAEIAIEMGDRCFQLAFENSMTGEPRILAEAKELVTTYLERHATAAGVEGVPA
jgi:hypothetical protein